jgi:hypothetical protein
LRTRSRLASYPNAIGTFGRKTNGGRRVRPREPLQGRFRKSASDGESTSSSLQAAVVPGFDVLQPERPAGCGTQDLFSKSMASSSADRPPRWPLSRQRTAAAHAPARNRARRR